MNDEDKNKSIEIIDDVKKGAFGLEDFTESDGDSSVSSGNNPTESEGDSNANK